METEVRPIHSEEDYDATLAKIDTLMNAKPGTAEGDLLDILVTLVEAYESKHYPIGMEMTSLQTERLMLRRLTDEDAANLLALDSDPDVMRFLGPPETDIEAHCRWLRERALPYYDAHPGYGFFAAMEKASGDFMGWFILRPALHYRFAREVGFQAGEVEVGYRLLPRFWNRGYATEGTKALIQKAFDALGVETVVAVALATNIGSWRVMEKAGMERTGEFPLPGYEPPAVVYRIWKDAAPDA